MTNSKHVNELFTACWLALAVGFTAALVSLQGCSWDAGRESDQEIEIDFRGKQYTVPANLEFNGKMWIRESENPRNNPFVLEYDYFGADRNAKVRYSQWPEASDFKESLSTYQRKDEQSPWRMNGKYRYLLKSGVWSEKTLGDPEQGGRAHGPYQYSYENGALKFSGQLFEDIEDGSAKGYYPDGSLWWSGVFEHARLTWDKTHFFLPDGNEMEGLDHEAKEVQYQLWKDMSVAKSSLENGSDAEKD